MGATDSRLNAGRYASSAFLQRPITEQSGDAGMGNGMRYGVSYMQGWRAHMEDAHITSPAMAEMPPGHGFFVVLDGHAGRKVAEYSAEVLEGLVAQEVRPVCGSATGIAAAMGRVFLRHDLAMQRNFDVLRSRSGSTCTSVLVTPTHFVFTNLGDSRSLLCRAGKVACATKDHKPTNPPERNRIKGAGGYVVGGRVDGGLAVSRAFGDFEYKMRTDLPAVRQKVSAEPECLVLLRDPPRDEFLLVACDGIWDVMTNQAAVKYVQGKLKKNGQDLEWVCQRLIKRCLELGSRDNMSVVLVVFDKGGAASRTYATTHAAEKTTAPPAPTEEQLAERYATAVAHTAVEEALASMRYCLNGTSILPREVPQAPRSSDLAAEESSEYLTIFAQQQQQQQQTREVSLPPLPSPGPRL